MGSVRSSYVNVTQTRKQLASRNLDVYVSAGETVGLHGGSSDSCTFTVAPIDKREGETQIRQTDVGRRKGRNSPSAGPQYPERFCHLVTC